MGLTVESSDGSFDGAGIVIYDGDWTADASEGGIGRVKIEGEITVDEEEYYVLIRVLSVGDTGSGTFVISRDGIRITGTYTSTSEVTGDLTGVKFTYP